MLLTNLLNIQQQIQAAETKYQRQIGSVQLLPVSKFHGIDKITSLLNAGINCFAENQVQSALEKITTLNNPDIEWHFIGSIQTNKTRDIANNFSWVHSIDRLKVAERLSNQRHPSLPSLNVCIQVNISNESNKSGVCQSKLNELAQAIHELPNLNLRGLMCIPAKSSSFSKQFDWFNQLSQAKENLSHLNLDTLSMGMSNDLEAAIAAGSTIVRIGTAIFGPRTIR